MGRDRLGVAAHVSVVSGSRAASRCRAGQARGDGLSSELSPRDVEGAPVGGDAPLATDGHKASSRSAGPRSGLELIAAP
jgi:hypothetical protein